jgi:hypothetical protein
VKSKEEIKGSLKVAARLPIGRQSDGGDGDWRQRTVVLVAGMLQSMRERENGSLRTRALGSSQ